MVKPICVILEAISSLIWLSESESKSESEESGSGNKEQKVQTGKRWKIDAEDWKKR